MLTELYVNQPLLGFKHICLYMQQKISSQQQVLCCNYQYSYKTIFIFPNAEDARRGRFPSKLTTSERQTEILIKISEILSTIVTEVGLLYPRRTVKNSKLKAADSKFSGHSNSQTLAQLQCPFLRITTGS